MNILLWAKIYFTFVFWLSNFLSNWGNYFLFFFSFLLFFKQAEIWLEESATDGNSNSYFSVFSVWWVESDPLLSIALRKSLPSFCPGTGLMDGGGWPRGSGRDPSKSLFEQILVINSICYNEIEFRSHNNGWIVKYKESQLC